MDSMLIKVLRAKLHRARVTEANVDYVGSITLDPDIYEHVGLLPGEAVLVADITNGQRFETYVLRGARGSRTVCVNGAAARLVRPGDVLIVMGFGYATAEEAAGLVPRIAVLDDRNEIVRDLEERPGETAG
jgi:aspartate 1-decarboxylase